jgi:hypothetical protein
MVADDKGAGSQLVKALIEAKKKFKTLAKNKVNPHFRNKYADLAAVYDAVDDALAANGLTVMQPLVSDNGNGLWIRTELLHVSGESKCSVYPLPGGVKSQELASAITYGRRYSLSSLLGIAADDEDDDGNGSQGAAASPQAETRKLEQKPAAKPGAAKKAEPNHWIGAIVKVDMVATGKWKLTGGDAAATEFGTSTPEHAALARTAVEKKTRVSIKFVTNQNGIKVVTGMDPMLEEGNGNGK